ncbi:hypothetical protein GCM10027341_20260 [Spirosoma knui]
MALVASITIVACKKDEVGAIDPAAKNTLSIEFDNRVGDQKLALGNPAYKTAAGEPFAVTAFNYFVSNIALKKEDGTTVTFPDQYFLVRQADAKTQLITLKDVPAGNYNELSFLIGVDSLKSVGGAGERTGVLDPTSYGDDGMYWSWNSGYIFMKLEGTSSAIPTTLDPDRKFQIHVGGYGGGWNGGAKTVNNLRRITLPMATKATVRGDIAPEVHLFVDALKILDGSTKISLATTSSIHTPAVATSIANNYTAMFEVDHVHNEKQ